MTALVAGEINRRDGLMDLAVGVVGPDGSQVLVFEGPNGALRREPETFAIPAEVAGLAIGQLDDHYAMDLAVAAGHELLIVHGRDRKLSLRLDPARTRSGQALSQSQQATVSPAAVDSLLVRARRALAKGISSGAQE